MSKKKKQITQSDLLFEFFKNNPNRDIHHPEVVDWATHEFKKRTGAVFRDPDRGVRNLHQAGKLIKVATGVYKYDPKKVTDTGFEDFTAKQKKTVLERDGYKCVICGIGKREGVVLHVDHVKPKDLGGKATLKNAQILCSKHNFLKKNLNQTETGKKMFIRLHRLAKEEGNENLISFCEDILETFEEHDINGHIEWSK